MNEDEKRDGVDGGWTLELAPPPPPKQVDGSSDPERQCSPEEKTEEHLNE